MVPAAELTVPHRPAAAEGDVPGNVSLRVFSLAVPIEISSRFCPVCQRETRFVFEFAFVLGFVGCCTGCGEDFVLWNTRTSSGASYV